MPRRPLAEIRKFCGLLRVHVGAIRARKLLLHGRRDSARTGEWNHDQSLDWHLLSDPLHEGPAPPDSRSQPASTAASRACISATACPRAFSGSRGGGGRYGKQRLLLRPHRRGRRETRVVVANYGGGAPVLREGYRIGVPSAGPMAGGPETATPRSTAGRAPATARGPCGRRTTACTAFPRLALAHPCRRLATRVPDPRMSQIVAPAVAGPPGAGPGPMSPLGASYGTARAPISRSFSGPCGKGGALPLRPAAAAARSNGSNCPSSPTRSGTATFRTCAPDSSTATASTAPYAPEGGTTASTLSNPLLLDPYALASTGATCAGTRRSSATSWASGHADLQLRTSRDSALSSPPPMADKKNFFASWWTQRTPEGAATSRPRCALGPDPDLRGPCRPGMTMGCDFGRRSPCAAPSRASQSARGGTRNHLQLWRAGGSRDRGSRLPCRLQAFYGRWALSDRI